MVAIRQRLIDSVKTHEGLRLKAYRDHLGHLTIGYGTNLEHLEITEETAHEWMLVRLQECADALESVAGFSACNTDRQDVLLEMAYQLGVSGLMRFRKMWAAIREQDWSGAADEIMDSRAGRDPLLRGRFTNYAARMRGLAA